MPVHPDFAEVLRIALASSAFKIPWSVAGAQHAYTVFCEAAREHGYEDPSPNTFKLVTHDPRVMSYARKRNTLAVLLQGTKLTRTIHVQLLVLPSPTHVDLGPSDYL